MAAAARLRTESFDAGFSDVSITFTNEVGDGVHSAIVKLIKPR